MRARFALLVPFVVAVIILMIWMLDERPHSQFERTGSLSGPIPFSGPVHREPSPVAVTPSASTHGVPPVTLTSPGHKHNLSLPTKDVIVRSVYWDNRHRDGHKGASVFMIEILRTALERRSIVGCKVGSNFTRTLGTRPVHNVAWVHQRHPECTYDMAMIDCYDVVAENGSSAYIYYKLNSTAVIAIESERPLFIPAPRVPPRKGKASTVMACTVVYGTPPLMEHWLRYQRTIGIDHVYIIAEESFKEAGNLEKNSLKEMMRSGYLSVEIWKPYLTSKEIFYHSQMLGYEDCIYRFQGTYDYLMATDPDIFDVLLVPGQPFIHYYAEKWCSKGSCVFKLIQYFYDCGISDVGADGNVTAHLLSNKHFDRREGKSGHKISAVVDIGIHLAFGILPGYDRVKIPPKKAYWAHIASGYAKMLPGGKC